MERYSTLASAAARRSLAVRADDIAVAYTDGETIFVPRDPGRSLALTLVVQGALLAAGSLDPRIVVRLVGRATAARRYLTLEAARAVGELGDAAPRHVVRAIAEHWSQCAPLDADESLRRALHDPKVPGAPPAFGAIRPSKLLRGVRIGAGSPPTAQDLSGDTEEQVPEVGDDEESEESKILKLLSLPAGFDNPLARWLRKRLGASRRSADPDGAAGGAEMPVAGRVLVNEVGAHAEPAAAPDIPVVAAAEPEPAGRAYPEWDCHRESYRRGWCFVRHFDPRPTERHQDFDPRSDTALRHRLAGLGMAYARHDRQEQGDALDLTALLDFAVARTLGEPGDDRVFQARLKSARDLGVLVLLDASGSTAEQRASGDPVWDEQRQLAANLVGALVAVGDRVAAYGFTSRGRHHVRFLRVKEFDGRYDQSALRRLASLEPAGFTRLGAALRHATHLVRTEAGTSHLLLVLVSDGFPYDDGYEGSYAEQDARRALDEAVVAGVGCVCLTVGTSSEDSSLERLWGRVPNARLANASELARHAVPLFRSALRAATAHR